MSLANILFNQKEPTKSNKIETKIQNKAIRPNEIIIFNPSINQTHQIIDQINENVENNFTIWKCTGTYDRTHLYPIEKQIEQNFAFETDKLKANNYQALIIVSEKQRKL